MKSFDQNDPQTSFGALKPVGNLFVVFDDEAKAKQAQDDLLTGGRTKGEARFMSPKEFIELHDDLREEESVFSLLGSERKKAGELRDSAEDGNCFLVVYAPSEQETKRVLSVADTNGFDYALKYSNFIIERFDAEKLEQ